MQMRQRLIERLSSVKAKSEMNKSQDDGVASGLAPPNHQYKWYSLIQKQSIIIQLIDSNNIDNNDNSHLFIFLLYLYGVARKLVIINGVWMKGHEWKMFKKPWFIVYMMVLRWYLFDFTLSHQTIYRIFEWTNSFIIVQHYWLVYNIDYF